MGRRHGDADYAAIGLGYSRYRQADPRIAAYIHQALRGARTVLNVGAGAGSYEPLDKQVTAVEPSEAMRSQRPSHLSLAIDAVAERLPFPDGFFDASMATFTIHQWSDFRAGLREMRRVTRGVVTVLTCDPKLVGRYWLNEYAAAVLEVEARRFPGIAAIATELGGVSQTRSVPIPKDCTDGFNEAYFGRPEWLLNHEVRRACSAWSFVDPSVIDHATDRLRQDLAEGTWDRRYGHLRTQPGYEGSLRLIISRR